MEMNSVNGRINNVKKQSSKKVNKDTYSWTEVKVTLYWEEIEDKPKLRPPTLQGQCLFPRHGLSE